MPSDASEQSPVTARTPHGTIDRTKTGTEMLSFHRFHVQCLKNIHRNSVCLLPFLCGVVVFLDRGRPPQSWYILPPLGLSFWLVISILRGQSTFHWSCSSFSSISIMLCFIGAVVASESACTFELGLACRACKFKNVCPASCKFFGFEICIMVLSCMFQQYHDNVDFVVL